MLIRGEMLAQYRVAVDPSIAISQVHDDNLFYSDQNPVSDMMLRVRPALGLQFKAPRWSATASYELDNNRYATSSALNDARARQQALIDIHYQAAPGLTFGLNGTYTDTDTPAELNIDTSLATSRIRARQVSLQPTARFQITPRISARASTVSTTEKLANGSETRAQFQTVGIDRRMSPRDLLTVDYEQARYIFDFNSKMGTTRTYTARAGWIHDVGPLTQLTLQGGPRITDGIAAPELLASLTHRWQFTSIALAAQQTQTTVLGYFGTVETRNVHATFTYTPTRSFTAYAAPAVFRSAQHDLEARVVRIALGARYAFTPLVGIDVAYSFDSQHGTIDPLRVNSGFSHHMLSVGLISRWKDPLGSTTVPCR
jgi:predicted porin